MSVREIMVTSKDLCADLQEITKLKNVRAVLLGSTRNHPLIANLNIPRSEGMLIKIDIETNGHTICAIVDTGSQLDVVSAEVAALKIQRTVDMSQVTGMHDANGGNSQLQGWIRDVEFNCGGAQTSTDLWVSRKPPFDLLLGRPWQRGNLVSIDEREEGTYLIFKDRLTRRPRFELLAVPYKGPLGDFRSEKTSHYQSFTIMTGNDLKIRRRGESEIRKRSAGKKNDEGRDPGNVLTKEAHHVKMICSQSRRREIVRGIFCFWNTACIGWNLVSGMLLLLQKSWLGRRRGDLEKKVSQNSIVLKDEECDESNSRNKPRLRSIDMSLAQPAPDKSLFAPTPHQYLSRDALNAPPAAAVALTTNDPAEIMTDAVARLWRKVTTGEPLVVSPSYAASPMMEYYGVVNFKDGTPAHLFSRLGNRTLMHDPANNKIHQSSGHELVYHFPAPVDPSELWKFEVPYPLDKNVHDTFFVLSDGFLAPDDPPMLPLEERLKGRSIAEYFTNVTAGSPSTDSETPTDNAASPVREGRVTVDLREVSRQVLAGFRAPIRVDSDIVKKLDEEIDRERVRKLGEEIHARAQRALSTGSDGIRDRRDLPASVSSAAKDPMHLLSTVRHDPLALILSSWTPPNRLQMKVCAPILNELFQISGRQPVTVQQIFDVAREAQRTTQDLAVAFEKRRAEEEGKIVEIFEGEMARVLSTLPEDVRRRLSQNAVSSSSGTSAVDVTAITAHADRIETPVLDYQRGRVVTRDLFSSSSPSSTHDSSSLDISYSTNLHQPSAPYNDWSPRISEWALLSGVPSADADAIHHQLHQWAHDCRASKDQFLSNIEETAAGPLRTRLLRTRLLRSMGHCPITWTYAYMAVHDHGTLHYLPPLSPPANHTSLSTPDPTQIPTSLDWSLPDSSDASQSSPAELTEANLARLQQQAGKQPEGPSRHPKVVQKSQRSHLSFTEPQTIRAVAGCRIALMEALYHLEILLWNHSAMQLEPSFPKTYLHHPFLSDYDAARAQTVWHALLRIGRDEVAALLHQMLVLRFREDYALARLFNAGFLEEQYPETDYRAWDLLRDITKPLPRAMHINRNDAASNSNATKPADAEIDSAMPDLDASEYELGYPESDHGHSREKEDDEIMADATDDSNDDMDLGSSVGSDFYSYCGSPDALARHSV
ncbi:hypothetical protein C8F04DRAFT_1147985 [Mycena alexandri]|uniref:Aspartic peptidase DDI1-type domain-containing protein n=1 Tax=Mycena alexandri TaxID=1745969 RepID=A0AAD6WNL8_9AGAR|nr:hypothetical protein C8F04DRAFT_1147985 [Mycena alexandri]